MKTLHKVFLLGLICALLFGGCAKPPTQEIDDTKAGVQAVTQEGADVYAKEELQRLNSEMTAALDEVKTQDEKFFKNYDKAKEDLTKIKAEAEELKITVAKRKEEAKNNAMTVMSEARTALDEATALVAQAPTGKDTQADIEAFKADLKGLEDAFPEIQQAITGGNYFGAIDKGKAINDKAKAISEEIKMALEKVKEMEMLKKGKKSKK